MYPLRTSFLKSFRISRKKRTVDKLEEPTEKAKTGMLKFKKSTKRNKGVENRKDEEIGETDCVDIIDRTPF